MRLPHALLAVVAATAALAPKANAGKFTFIKERSQLRRLHVLGVGHYAAR